MDSCCENKTGEVAQLRAKQGRVLYIVLAINAAMFLFEFISAWFARSTALLGDSLEKQCQLWSNSTHAVERRPKRRQMAAARQVL